MRFITAANYMKQLYLIVSYDQRWYIVFVMIPFSFKASWCMINRPNCPVPFYFKCPVTWCVLASDYTWHLKATWLNIVYDHIIIIMYLWLTMIMQLSKLNVFNSNLHINTMYRSYGKITVANGQNSQQVFGINSECIVSFQTKEILDTRQRRM